MIARPLFLPRAILLASAALLAAGCSVKTHDNGQDGASITIGKGGDDDGGNHSVSINAPGFSAKMNLPNLDLGSGTMQIDDMKIFPGTKIHGVDIAGDADKGDDGGDDGEESGKGQVEMGFTAPGGVDQVIAWYRDQARKTGWTIVTPTAGNQFEATKPGDHGPARFALRVTPTDTGSDGHFTITGR